MKHRTFLPNYSILSHILTAVISITIIACADNIADQKDNSKENVQICFDVSDVQSEILSRAIVGKQGNTPQQQNIQTTLELQTAPNLINNKDLVHRKLNATSTDGTQACIIESTIAGINPTIQQVSSRANVITKKTLSDFSVMGYRGKDEANISTAPNWFYNVKADKEGKLKKTLYWDWNSDKYARFYAIYPYTDNTANNKIKLSDKNYTGTPYLHFEVEQDVTKQQDLMTACTGVVKYEKQNVAPKSHLAFRHALTAIRFKIGGNLSWNKTIDKVEIINALSKGTYTLSQQANGTKAEWKNLSDRKTFTLGGDGSVNIKTSQAENQIIVGKDNDNYTFYMIPQQLTGKNVKVSFHFTDGTTTTASLYGEWKAGTTKTYALSQKQSTWEYQLIVDKEPKMIGYNETKTDNYTITSYRVNGDKKQPIGWKVVGYDANGDGKYSMNEKPDWFVGLSENEGGGSIEAKEGHAILKAAPIVDLVALHKTKIQQAKSLGTEKEPYDLSTCGGKTKRNTANCYIISAPGHYTLPLVYGNAIKDGKNNTSAYKTKNKGDYILENFKDHEGTDIDNPWIKQTNKGKNIPTNGKLIWADAKGIVRNIKINKFNDEGSLQFEVPKEAIKCGNAVVAVTFKDVILWSWHLWFAPKEFLNTTACYTDDNKEYRFADAPLGFKYTECKGTAYQKPRTVSVKIQQVAENGKEAQKAVLRFAQNIYYTSRKGTNTIYQFGRKDAFPSSKDLPEGSVIRKMENNEMTIQNSIQHPNSFYTYGKRWKEKPPIGYTYVNLWSMNNTRVEEGEEVSYSYQDVVKTIYDPCPVGFKMPPPHAFSMWIKKEADEEEAEEEVDEEVEEKKFKEQGYYLNNRKENANSMIFFPSLYFIYDLDANSVNDASIFGTAIPNNTYDENYNYNSFLIAPPNFISIIPQKRALGCAVRPIAE